MLPRRRDRPRAGRVRRAPGLPVAALGRDDRGVRRLLRRPDGVPRGPQLRSASPRVVTAARCVAAGHPRQALAACDLGRVHASVRGRPPDRVADRHRRERPADVAVRTPERGRCRGVGDRHWRRRLPVRRGVHHLPRALRSATRRSLLPRSRPSRSRSRGSASSAGTPNCGGHRPSTCRPRSAADGINSLRARPPARSRQARRRSPPPRRPRARAR